MAAAHASQRGRGSSSRASPRLHNKAPRAAAASSDEASAGAASSASHPSQRTGPGTKSAASSATCARGASAEAPRGASVPTAAIARCTGFIGGDSSAGATRHKAAAQLREGAAEGAT